MMFTIFRTQSLSEAPGYRAGRICAAAVFMLLFILVGDSVVAGEIPELEEILVTSRHAERSLYMVAADVRILSREDIDRLNARTISEVLDTIASVDLIARGTPASQSDITIRGSSFESVLILINGIRVHDPQTGHFTMHLPIDLSSVDRIEVLRGGGSSAYGSSASGGAINIVTKGPGQADAREETEVQNGISLGSHRTGDLSFMLARSRERSHLQCSVGGGKSEGYRKNSDLTYAAADALGAFSTGDWAIKWNAGFQRKEFGAADFYAPYPSFERNFIVLGGIHVTRFLGEESLLRLRFGGRGNGNDFTLVRDKPELYRNTHYNRSYSFAAEYLTNRHRSVSLLLGTEAEKIGITGGTLGSHSNRNIALYGEVTARMFGAYLSTSLRLDTGFRDETILSPGFGLLFPVGEESRIRFRAERSFRSPTYTELYYDSPANRGNPSLNSEHTVSYTAGFDTSVERLNLGFTLFGRETTEVIDWVRGGQEEAWQATNHGRLITNGVGINCSLPLFSPDWHGGFEAVMLDQSVSRHEGIESKYALHPLEKTLTATISGSFISQSTCTLIMRYEEEKGRENRIPVTLRITRDFGRIRNILSIRNLFNEPYAELPGLPAPGRWFDLRMEYAR